MVVSFNYDLPVGKGRMLLTHLPTPLEWIIGGWQGNGIYTYRTGIPLQISNGVNQTNLGSPGQRPNNNGNSAKLSGAGERPAKSVLRHQSSSRRRGSSPSETRSRTSPDLRAPSLHNIDFSIFKNFSIRERVTLRYQAEFYNGTNTPLWNSPGTTVNAVSGFGVITSASAQRVCQMALKLIF